MKNMQLIGGGTMVGKLSAADECLKACCAQTNCTAWNYHVSSTDSTHHPKECWLSTLQHPVARPGESSDVWAGGSKSSFKPVKPPGIDHGGAAIQKMSHWFYYASTHEDTLLRELTDQSLRALRKRSGAVAQLAGKDAWENRKQEAKAALEQIFSPLPSPNRTAPTFKVVETLTRPTYSVDKILYQTRPGFYVPAALWTPTGLKKAKKSGRATKAPGILMVSGHTPDGFRSNNMNGPIKDNAPADDDYEVVEINLVARGFVVLAFDPIGQGERMQYADVPQGAASEDAPWSKGADGAYLWGSTADHEYMGRQLLLNGVGLMSFWLHDEMLSLDLLAGLPYVDEAQLGVVGCSGGGTQSSYLGAMDPRVKAASMACYMSTFEIDRLWAAGGASDGEQTWPQGVVKGLDKPDLLEARAADGMATQVLITVSGLRVLITVSGLLLTFCVDVADIRHLLSCCWRCCRSRRGGGCIRCPRRHDGRAGSGVAPWLGAAHSRANLTVFLQRNAAQAACKRCRQTACK
jgi:hypothetical protein